MTDTAISPLRQRMIEDMTIRKLGAKTQAGYIRAVKNFATFLGHSPDRAGIDDIRRYQLHLASGGLGVPSVNAAMTALRLFFKVTLRRGEAVEDIVFAREPRRLPVVLSPEEVARLLAAAPDIQYQAALSIAYGAGLRASEVISLKVGDIDSTRMLIRVDQGKGHKDRYVMLSPPLLHLLRRWWLVKRPRVWLFPGQVPGAPLTVRQLNRAIHEAARTCGSRTTPAATATARSARRSLPRNGWPSGKPNCCRCPTSTSCSVCRRRSPPSPGRTRPSFTACCSRLRPRRLSPLPRTPSTLARASD